MPTSTPVRAVSGRVHGRVQGVSFRASMQAEARRLGVGGWVRNQPDGAVAFFAQGGAAALDALLDWAGSGPPGARVDTLEVQEETPEPGTDPAAVTGGSAFRILR